MAAYFWNALIIKGAGAYLRMPHHWVGPTPSLERGFFKLS